MKEIENTPFAILKENEKYYVVWGQYKLTEPKKSEDDARDALYIEEWLLTARMVFAAIHASRLLEDAKKAND